MDSVNEMQVRFFYHFLTDTICFDDACHLKKICKKSTKERLDGNITKDGKYGHCDRPVSFSEPCRYMVQNKFQPIQKCSFASKQRKVCVVFTIAWESKHQVIRATFSSNLWRNIIAKLCCPYYHPRKQLVKHQDLHVAKSRTEFYFVQHVPATCNTEILVGRQVACGGGNTDNKALQLAKQQCCATSYKEILPVLLDFNEEILLPILY